MAWVRAAVALSILASHSSSRIHLVRGDIETINLDVGIEGEASEYASTTIINDEYCDLSDGSDETKTPACSHLGVAFVCNENDVTATIPTSRVNDGICDCCNGSDETDNEYVLCENTCGAELIVQKRLALAEYRAVQAGLRARTEITEKLRKKKIKDASTFEKMLEERRDIRNFLISK